MTHYINIGIARFIIQEILEDGYFHADPHPGNLIVLPGNIIGLIGAARVARPHLAQEPVNVIA